MTNPGEFVRGVVPLPEGGESDRQQLFLGNFGSAVGLARSKAVHLVWALALPPADVEDLTQDLLSHIWFSLRIFDPRRSAIGTFIRRAAEGKAISIFRALSARKRLCSTTIHSIDDFWEGSERDGNVSVPMCRPDEQLLALRIDVARAMTDLSPELRQIAGALALHNRSESARQIGITRPTLHRRLAKIRSLFADRGLDQYLSRPVCRQDAADFGSAGRTVCHSVAYIIDEESVRPASARRPARGDSTRRRFLNMANELRR
jgi:RNA polymerase sigma factor (sigma-70 family)